MKTYTKEEIIEELAQNMCVMQTGYGTWKTSSYIGNRNNKISFSEITHQEEDEKLFGSAKWCDKIDEFKAEVKNVEEE